MLDFYKGFEGEPEIRFALVVPNAPEVVIAMWDGYFRALIELASPVNGCWNGLALPFHTDRPWSNAPWRVSNLSEVLHCWADLPLENLPQGFDTCRDVHTAVLEIMRSALSTGGEIWLSEE